MTLHNKLALFIFVISLFGLSVVFLLYPLSVFFLTFFAKKEHKPPIYLKRNDSVSIILAFWGDKEILKQKLHNFISLTYPKEKLELVICFDGPELKLESIEKLKEEDYRIKTLFLGKRLGKTYALNEAVKYSKGDFLLFTDADAMFEPDVIDKLLRHFEDPEIGGVFGCRKIQKERESIEKAQHLYIALENFLKETESKIGSTTSNDGKIYMIRREYFEPIAPNTTDDLYCALRIIKKGKRFIFQKDAIAYIKKPSKDLKHEFKRRQRIVSQSMNSLWLNKELFNPLKYGFYSIGLFINKVLRRFLILFMFGLLISSLILSWLKDAFEISFISQMLFYGTSLIYPLFQRIQNKSPTIRILKNISGTILYFLIGCLGSLMGVYLFLKGDIPSTWESIKE